MYTCNIPIHKPELHQQIQTQFFLKGHIVT